MAYLNESSKTRTKRATVADGEKSGGNVNSTRISYRHARRAVMAREIGFPRVTPPHAHSNSELARKHRVLRAHGQITIKPVKTA